jgi:hypothetical protein
MSFITKSPKISRIFYCETCHYKCSKQSEFNKHILTKKHQNLQNPTFSLQNPTLNTNIKTYNCICGKIYKHSSTLYNHKKNCKLKTLTPKIVENNSNINNPTDNNIILTLMKRNDELQNIIFEVIKNNSQFSTTNNNTNNNTNILSNNKSFNLNFFLNETCKDAMNIMDFVDSIKLQLSDLENVGKFGYVKGISNIIVKTLKELDISERPLHCTDKKREIIYVKDENKWEKDYDKKKLHKVVKKVAFNNTKMLSTFKEVHPDCIKSCSKFSDQYNKIIIESMGGTGDNDFEKEEKIIKTISKEVFVEKC